MLALDFFHPLYVPITTNPPPATVSARRVVSPLFRRLARSATVIGLIVLLAGPLGAAFKLVLSWALEAGNLRTLGIWGPLMLVLLQVIQVIVAVLPGQMLLPVAGHAYGFAGGLLINLLATTAGGQMAFLLARQAGRPLVERLVPARTLDRWVARVDQRSFLFFVLVFMIPIFPTDVMNFAAGLGAVSPRRYLLAALLGRVPLVALGTLAGSHGLQWSGLLSV